MTENRADGTARPVPADDLGEPVGQAVRQLADRIRTLLDEEQRLVQSPEPADYERLVARKEHLLAEAVRLSRQVQATGTSGLRQSGISAAADALKANAELLRRHVDAVSEICGLISRHFASADSDGTYTSASGGRSIRP